MTRSRHRSIAPNVAFGASHLFRAWVWKHPPQSPSSPAGHLETWTQRLIPESLVPTDRPLLLHLSPVTWVSLTKPVRLSDPRDHVSQYSVVSSPALWAVTHCLPAGDRRWPYPVISPVSTSPNRLNAGTVSKPGDICIWYWYESPYPACVTKGRGRNLVRSDGKTHTARKTIPCAFSSTLR